MDPLERLRRALADRYDIDRAVGEGGMASVFGSLDRKHQRRVAIKVLKPELAASIGTERFLREIRVAAQLQHPNILALYDSGEADGLVYYVMPFVEGESLRDRLDREKQLPVDDAIRTTLEVADALQYAHGHGVVHRDIKPDNILLLKSGGHALVMDFGIARAFSEAGGDKLTQTGMAVGTPHYMSPEQAGGGAGTDGRSDLYSLACVLYEMLAGQPPFDGPNTMAILARHAMETVPSIQVVRPTIPDALEDIIMTGLAKTPADRYPSVSAFADAIASADFGLISGRTLARAIPRRTQAQRIAGGAGGAARSPRQRALITGGGTLLLAVAVAAGMLLRGGGRTAAPPVAASAEARRVAVLYFDHDASEEADLLAGGLTEDLIRDLAGAPGVDVISQNGVAPFRDTDTPRDSIAGALGVGTIVSGTVERAGSGKVRVGVRLADASGTDFRRGSFTLAAGNPGALRDSLAGEVSAFLRERLGQEIRLRTQLAKANDPEAWSMVQRAEREREAWQGALNSTGAAAADHHATAADSLLQGATARDPRWSTPWIQRGWLRYQESRLAGGAPLAAKPLIDEALAFADTALAREPANPDALELRGTARYWGFLLRLAPNDAAAAENLRLARADLEEATKVSPTQAGAWATLSHLYYQVDDGRTTDALIAAQRAYESDTYLANVNLVLERLFNASYDLGQVTDAHRWCAEGRRRFPDDPRFQICRLWEMTMKGQTPDIAEGWRIIQTGNVVVPGRGSEEFQRRRARLALATCLARAGLADSAKAVAQTAARTDADVDPSRELSLTLAFALATAGDKGGAIAALKVYFAANPAARRGLAEDAGWWFRDLENDPEFRALFSAL